MLGSRSVFGAGDESTGGSESNYSFVYLGDLHLDQAAHHDVEWLTASKPHILQESAKYVRSTELYTPLLLKQVRTLADASDGRIQMVIQGGDLVEGLCGRYELQMDQFAYAKEVIKRYLGPIPFISVKGNHDITGPGADEAYRDFMLPWMAEECGQPVESASFHIMKGPDLFVFFDAYGPADLDWLQKTLTENPHRYLFVVMHQPVVPYTARSTWHLFAKSEEQSKQDTLLRILGDSHAIVLTAHLHRFTALERKTPNGSFVQFSMGSVIGRLPVVVKYSLEGVDRNGGDLVDLEPDFEPETVDFRRRILDDERDWITRFDFADFPGSAVLHVSDAGVSADVYVGASAEPWKSVQLVHRKD